MTNLTIDSEAYRHVLFWLGSALEKEDPKEIKKSIGSAIQHLTVK